MTAEIIRTNQSVASTLKRGFI